MAVGASAVEDEAGGSGRALLTHLLRDTELACFPLFRKARPHKEAELRSWTDVGGRPQRVLHEFCCTAFFWLRD
jgi:hypothetical protein